MKKKTENKGQLDDLKVNNKSYLNSSTFKIWLIRAPWLVLLMISSTFTGLIISRNENILNKGIHKVILTSCIPMIMGTGGNAGGQTSATIIREMALSDFSFKGYIRIIWKELCVSVLLGLSLSVICFAKIILLDGLVFNVEGVTTLSATIISVSMYMTIILAKTIGAALPILAKLCKLDPAVIANPIITTVIDILSLLVYCKLSTAFLT